MRRHVRTLATLFLVSAAAAPALRAQACDSVTSRTSLAAFAGDTVREVRVVTLGPARLPGAARIANDLHVRTRPSTVRHHLLFAAGAALDTLKVAESLRWLRTERYLSDAEVMGVRCAGEPGVTVVVTTRDAWSARPKVQQSGGGSLVGFTERNVLGTGREASLYVRSSQSRIGIGAALRDPWFLGSSLAARLTTDSYRDGTDVGALLGTRPTSVYDVWRAQLRLHRLQREAADSAGDDLRRESGSLLAMRRIHVGRSAVTSLLGEVEGERSTLLAGHGAIVLGPTQVRREYSGAGVGLQRRSASWDTLTWLLPRAPIVDVPLAWEGEGLVGYGWERVSGQPAARLDLWTGRMWLPSRRSLLVADLWASGYRVGRVTEAGSMRAQLAYYRSAPRGTWTVRVAGEHLYRPDPDVRALATADPTLRALPDSVQLAEGAMTGVIERAVRLLPLSKSWALDGALFGASSWRFETARPEITLAAVTMVGVGLRLTPTKTGRGAAMLSVGYPVAASLEVRRRAIIGVTVTPWIAENRGRDGERDR